MMQSGATKAYPINPGDPDYPRALLGGQPPILYSIGNSAILSQSLTAILCSNRCPGAAIIRALDATAQLRESNRAVISGFHTPIEKECLRILLRGASSIVICPARSLDRLRVPSDWKPALDAGRLLLVSPFPPGTARMTADLAQRRNEFVAALATEIIVLHASPGGRLETLIRHFEQIGRQVTRRVGALACPSPKDQLARRIPPPILL